MTPGPHPSDPRIDDGDRDLVFPIGGREPQGNPTREGVVGLVLGAVLAAATWWYGHPAAATAVLAVGMAWCWFVVSMGRGRHVLDGTRLATRHGITGRVVPRADLAEVVAVTRTPGRALDLWVPRDGSWGRQWWWHGRLGWTARRDRATLEAVHGPMALARLSSAHLADENHLALRDRFHRAGLVATSDRPYPLARLVEDLRGPTSVATEAHQITSTSTGSTAGSPRAAGPVVMGQRGAQIRTIQVLITPLLVLMIAAAVSEAAAGRWWPWALTAVIGTAAIPLLFLMPRTGHRIEDGELWHVNGITGRRRLVVRLDTVDLVTFPPAVAGWQVVAIGAPHAYLRMFSSAWDSPRSSWLERRVVPLQPSDRDLHGRLQDEVGPTVGRRFFLGAMSHRDQAALFQALRDAGLTPVGVEAYPMVRRDGPLAPTAPTGWR